MSCNSTKKKKDRTKTRPENFIIFIPADRAEKKKHDGVFEKRFGSSQTQPHPLANRLIGLLGQPAKPLDDRLHPVCALGILSFLGLLGFLSFWTLAWS